MLALHISCDVDAPTLQTACSTYATRHDELSTCPDFQEKPAAGLKKHQKPKNISLFSANFPQAPQQLGESSWT
jgi:hypothetical protein